MIRLPDSPVDAVFDRPYDIKTRSHTLRNVIIALAVSLAVLAPLYIVSQHQHSRSARQSWQELAHVKELDLPVCDKTLLYELSGHAGLGSELNSYVRSSLYAHRHNCKQPAKSARIVLICLRRHTSSILASRLGLWNARGLLSNACLGLYTTRASSSTAHTSRE